MRKVHRAAYRSAKLVLVVRGARDSGLVRKIIVGIENCVAYVFPQVPVPMIRSRFEGGIDDSAGRVTKFCAEVTGLEFELLDRSGGRKNGRDGVCTSWPHYAAAAVDLLIVVNAIQPNIVLNEVLAHHAEVGIIRSQSGGCPGRQHPQG